MAMKKLLLFLILCAFASTMFAQWHRMPPPRRQVYHYGYNYGYGRGYGMAPRHRVIIHRQPRIIYRQYGAVNMRFGPVYYGGGWGANVIFLRQPRIIVQQPRIVYARTPRSEAEAGILNYMINKGDIIILVDQELQQPADSADTD